MIILQNKHYSPKHEEIYLFPGSFNPFHGGHLSICDRVRKEHNILPVLEITRNNADKGEVPTSEIWNRLLNIESYNFPAIATTTSIFADKILHWAEKDKKQTYIMGLDTWNRLNNPQYYPLDSLYDMIEKYEVSFLVFNRGYQEFVNPGIQRVKYYHDFSDDTSSTKIRNQ